MNPFFIPTIEFLRFGIAKFVILHKFDEDFLFIKGDIFVSLFYIYICMLLFNENITITEKVYSGVEMVPARRLKVPG